MGVHEKTGAIRPYSNFLALLVEAQNAVEKKDIEIRPGIK